MTNNLKLLKKIKDPIFYVSNDVSRGIGLENFLPNYHFICLDDSPLVETLLKSGFSVFCLERYLGEKNKIFRNTGLILAHPSVLSFIKQKSAGKTPNVMFFKPQNRIEFIARKEHFRLIGNPVSLNRMFEDKISFFQICQKHNLPVPEGEIIDFAKVNYHELSKKYGEKMVFQFGRGWAGNSTFVIENQGELAKIKLNNLEVPVKVNKFIEGRTVLNNAVVFRGEIFVSEPALQVRANSLLTSTQTGTGGRQWPAKLSEKQKDTIKEITQKVGQIMDSYGFKGFFGLDFVLEKDTEKVYLIEANARLTYSVPFFTKAEISQQAFPLLAFHLLSFLPGFEREDLPNYQPTNILGGEIVVRNTETFPVTPLQSIPTGIFTKDLIFKNESYFLDTSNPSFFWLTTTASGKRINPEIEYLKIQTTDFVCDENGNLLPKYSKIILDVKDKLQLRQWKA